MEGGKNQTSSPQLPEKTGFYVILPWGKTRITFISTNGWSRHFRRSARYAFLRSGSAFTCSGRVIPGKYFTFSWVFCEFQRCQNGHLKESAKPTYHTHHTKKKVQHTNNWTVKEWINSKIFRKTHESIKFIPRILTSLPCWRIRGLAGFVI